MEQVMAKHHRKVIDEYMMQDEREWYELKQKRERKNKNKKKKS